MVLAERFYNALNISFNDEELQNDVIEAWWPHVTSGLDLDQGLFVVFDDDSAALVWHEAHESTIATFEEPSALPASWDSLCEQMPAAAKALHAKLLPEFQAQLPLRRPV